MLLIRSLWALKKLSGAFIARLPTCTTNTFVINHIRNFGEQTKNANSSAHLCTVSFLFSPGNYGLIEPSMISHVRVCVCVRVCGTIGLIPNIFGTTHRIDLKFRSLILKAIARMQTYTALLKLFSMTRWGCKYGSKRHLRLSRITWKRKRWLFWFFDIWCILVF